MPADSLSLSIGVGCKINIIGFIRFLFQILNKSFLTLYDGIFRSEIMLNINRKPCRRQIANMTHGGNNLIPLAEIAFYIFRLCRRLHNYKL